MAHHEFLRRLGLYTIPEFLSREECARWRAIAVATGGKEARVYRDDDVLKDDEVRKTLEVAVQDPVQGEMKDRLRGLRSELEVHFGVSLAGLDYMNCLMYRTGDFFRMHSDSLPADTADLSAANRNLVQRTVSIVIFLNDPHDAQEPYAGGELTFYGLMDTPKLKEYGFPVDAECGLLVAFRSETVHEVKPVTEGKRYTLVTWFLATEPSEASHADHTGVKTEVQGVD